MLGLFAGLAALAPASADASTAPNLVVPNNAPAPVIKPQAAAPPPSAPSAPAPSASEPSGDPMSGPAYDPTSADIRANLDPSATPTSKQLDPGVSALDVGHGIDQTYGQNTSEVDLNSRGEIERELKYAQDLLENLQAENWWLLPAYIDNPFAAATALDDQTALVGYFTQKLEEFDENDLVASMDEPEAVRHILGYSGVSDQACGADYSEINGEIEDGNSGVQLC